jgi:hypothetical protein
MAPLTLSKSSILKALHDQNSDEQEVMMMYDVSVVSSTYDGQGDFQLDFFQEDDSCNMKVRSTSKHTRMVERVRVSTIC